MQIRQISWMVALVSPGCASQADCPGGFLKDNNGMCLQVDAGNDGLPLNGEESNEGQVESGEQDVVIEEGVYLGTEWTQVTAGTDHTCALDLDGFAQCWGSNNFSESIPPYDVAFDEIEAGNFVTCGLSKAGEVWCWGRDAQFLMSDIPAGPVSQLSLNQGAGGVTLCAVELGGTLACWGTGGASVGFPPSGAFVEVQVGSDYGCALRSDGSYEVWGHNPPASWLLPNSLFRSVTATSSAVCGVVEDRTAVDCGNLLTPPSGYSTTRSVRQIDGHRDTICYVDDTGPIYCNSAAVEPPDGRRDWVQAAVGDGFVCGLTGEGEILCWGDNDRGQTDVPW